MIKPNRVRFFLMLALSAPLLFSEAAAQTPATNKPTDASLVVEQRLTVPQVVTVLHRVNGLKMLRLLLRSGQKFSALESTEDAFGITNQVHTNIIAGLSLDDGQTIVAWLPDAEAEVDFPFADVAQPNAFGLPASNPPGVPSAASRPGFIGIPQSAPDLAIVERDGKRHTVRYIGLDGITGLSLLKLSSQGLSASSNASDQEIFVGQRMRLFSPEPAPRTDSKMSAGGNSSIYVRIGETEGQVISIARGASGRLSRIRIKSAKLSAANIGAIAVNDLGQTVGIVDGVEGSEASVLPPEVIRSAAQRVIARQSSVPRPWLGVRGASVAGTPFEQILRNGWKREKALTLFDDQRGILLTSVIPGSPAAVAALRPGDVILQVNDGEVKSEDDFSSLLEEAGGGNQVRFTVARPDQVDPQAIVVKLSGSLDPLFASRMIARNGTNDLITNPLLERGIEAIAIRPPVPNRPGAAAGLLVVYVQPATAAFKSGLRPGDVIEAFNGQSILTTPPAQIQQVLKTTILTLDILRNKQKFVFKIVSSKD